jgi:tellurite resistance protein
MATKADFTEGEWHALQKGVTGAGMLVSVSDADFTDSFGEASALAKFLGEQRQKNESELVREVAAVHGGGFGLTTSREKVETETMAALRSAVMTLSTKAPDEVAAYRQLVLDLAQAVAGAKGGVTETETKVIDNVREALGST